MPVGDIGGKVEDLARDYAEGDAGSDSTMLAKLQDYLARDGPDVVAPHVPRDLRAKFLEILRDCSTADRLWSLREGEVENTHKKQFQQWLEYFEKLWPELKGSDEAFKDLFLIEAGGKPAVVEIHNRRRIHELVGSEDWAARVTAACRRHGRVFPSKEALTAFAKTAGLIREAPSRAR